MSNATFTYRIAWALKQIGKSNNDLAQILGVNKNTIAAYKNEKGDLKGIVLAGLTEEFNFNPGWLLTGEGDPYIKKEKEVSQVSAKPATYKKKKQPKVDRVEAPSGEYISQVKSQGLKISDALAMAARVLESGTSYATALYLNIQHFDRAVQAEARIAHVEENQKTLEDIIKALQAKISAMEKQLTELKNCPRKRITR